MNDDVFILNIRGWWRNVRAMTEKKLMGMDLTNVKQKKTFKIVFEFSIKYISLKSHSIFNSFLCHARWTDSLATAFDKYYVLSAW